jgi:hypothetical protein
MLDRSSARWASILLGWILASVLLAPEAYLHFLYGANPISWPHVLALTAVNVAIAAVMAPAVVWLARRFPIERAGVRLSLAVHLPACLAFSIAHALLYAAMCYARPALFHVMYLRFHPNLITYFAIVGFTQAFDYLHKVRVRDRELAETKLELLRAQLHPHFLFNTLHAISAMVRDEPALAERMIARLSDVLRSVLDGIGKQELPLHDELAFVATYVEIHAIRFGDRLALELDVQPEVLDALVPTMLLQPLVENSIRHGFDRGSLPGVIRVQARRVDGELVVAVRDDGRGVVAGAREGLGLCATRQRLDQLYPAQARFALGNAAAGGAIAEIRIPFHTEGQHARARRR